MKMRVLLCLSLATIVLTLSACATTSSGSKSDTRLKRSADFIQNTDGSAYSPRTGIYCPSMIDGLSLQSAKNYIADASDLGCDYGGDGRKFSMFLSNIPGASLSDYFDNSVQSLKQVFEPRGYKYSEALSSSCGAASIDGGSLMSAILTAKDNTVTVSSWPAAVFTKEDWMSIIGIDEVARGEFMKMRYTLPATSKDDADEACTFAYEHLRSFRNKMNEERGIEKSDDEKMSDFLKAIADQKS